MKYSPRTGCFYPPEVAYTSFPVDAIESSLDEFNAAAARGPRDTLAVIDGKVTVVPWTGPTLAEAKAEQILTLRAAYAAALVAPVAYTTAAGATASFAQGEQAAREIDSVLALGADRWTADIWLDATGNPVAPFSFADVEGLKAAIASADAPAHVDLLLKIAAVHAADSVAAVQAVTFQE